MGMKKEHYSDSIMAKRNCFFAENLSLRNVRLSFEKWWGNSSFLTYIKSVLLSLKFWLFFRQTNYWRNIDRKLPQTVKVQPIKIVSNYYKEKSPSTVYRLVSCLFYGRRLRDPAEKLVTLNKLPSVPLLIVINLNCVRLLFHAIPFYLGMGKSFLSFRSMILKAFRHEQIYMHCFAGDVAF